ncbi:MAG: discoidin domain-containing protein [Myxococcales bacterium]|nr:discoidin domain-containing protein [Myxococcales bacterium]
MANPGHTTNEAGNTGTLTIAVKGLDPRRDVDGFVVTIHPEGASCADAPLETFSSSLQWGNLPDGSAPDGTADARLVADGVVILEPGTYLACAQPVTESGDASAECAPVEQTFGIVEGSTIELVLVSQCAASAPGGVGLSTILNSPPLVMNLEVAPSRFVETCQETRLEVTAEDPEGDAIAFDWQMSDNPDEASFDFEVGESPGQANFQAYSAGQYLARVQVTDSLGGSTALEVPLFVTLGDPRCSEAPPITVRATSVTAPWVPENALDPARRTYWMSDINSGNEEWVELTYGEGFVATSVQIILGNGRDGAWPTVQGSMDGKSWDELASVHAYSYPLDEHNLRHIAFDFENTKAYRYYRYHSHPSVYVLLQYLNFQ